jgi:hypothetical protein
MVTVVFNLKISSAAAGLGRPSRVPATARQARELRFRTVLLRTTDIA